MESQDRWQWLQNGIPKRETGSLICAAQEQAIRTNPIKGKIEKLQEQTQCRICSRADKTIKHIISKCFKLAQKEYKKRLDWIERRIYWEICGVNEIRIKPKWFEHQQEGVVECKIL